MISVSLHHTLCCDGCGCSYGELGNPENIQGALKGTGWGIMGPKVFCDRCYPDALLNPDNLSLPLPPIDYEEWGKPTRNGWWKTSEQLPPKGIEWVEIRMKDGNRGFGKYDYSNKWWETETGEIIESPEYWHYPIVFP